MILIIEIIAITIINSYNNFNYSNDYNYDNDYL